MKADPKHLPPDWKDHLIRSEPKDIAAQASNMPPNFGILYPPRDPAGSDPPAFQGMLRARDAGLYWVAARLRSVNGRLVLELQFRPKS
jgi:hypothetical protein